MTRQRRQLTAGVVLSFGVVYIVFEFLAAMAWTAPPYDWARNLISDLGFSDCAVIDGSVICSPLHPLMNAGFMIQGTVFVIGSILVTRLMVPRRGMRIVVLSLLVTSGIGTFMVGVLHQGLALYAAGLNVLHVVAATLAIGAGNIGILLLGVVVLREAEWRGYGIAVVVIAIVGTAAGVLLMARNDLGIGLGFIERVSVYPLNTWTIGTGVGLVVKSLRESRRSRATQWRQPPVFPTMGA